MKRVMLTLMVLGILGVLAAPVLAGGPGYHYGGHYGGHYGYNGGWGMYRAYYPPVYVYNSPARMFPYHPAIPPLPIAAPYYYYPSTSFYYSSPSFSIGFGY
jgi:hypothetical protein